MYALLFFGGNLFSPWVRCNFERNQTTVAHICKHNTQFLKHNSISLKQNKQFSKQNTVLSKHNKGLSKHNTDYWNSTIFAKHNTIFVKHNTQFSRLRNAGFVAFQSKQQKNNLLNRWHVMRLDCKLPPFSLSAWTAEKSSKETHQTYLIIISVDLITLVSIILRCVLINLCCV